MRKLLLITTTFLMPLTAQAGALDWANGEWALDPAYAGKDEQPKFRCGGETLQITINADKGLYISQESSAEPRKAQIVSSNELRFTIKYENEDRLMDNGKHHVWTMVFLDEDHFVWVRQDWMKNGVIGGQTVRRVRCEGLEVS